MSSGQIVAEMKEFSTFTGREQRYLRCSLDVAMNRGNAVWRWGRNDTEKAEIKAQMRVYTRLKEECTHIPRNFDLIEWPTTISILLRPTAYDLNRGQLSSFPAYRFLYERILGPKIRPWLPGAFCAAAASPLPGLEADVRKSLLTSLSEAAALAPAWSKQEPIFFPEWVDKEDV